MQLKKERMNQYIRTILIIICAICLTINFSCRTQIICGTFASTHEITFKNDSTYKYTNWEFDTDTNSFGYYSEGRYLKIDKNTYILNSYDFNPDSIEVDYNLKTDTSLSGFRIKITTELEREDFDFHYDTLCLDIDNKIYKFTKSQIDTTIFTDNIEKIGLRLITQPDSIIPASLIARFAMIPIENIPEKYNFIEIHFPISSIYYNWINIDNKVLYKNGKSKKSKYFIWNDNSPIKLKNE